MTAEEIKALVELTEVLRRIDTSLLLIAIMFFFVTMGVLILVAYILKEM